MTSRQDKDLELLQLILQTNDSKSSNELYGFYTDEIKCHIKKKFKLTEEDAEDLTSDTVIKMLSNLFSYEKNKSNFRTWVITIADNTVINFKKKLSNNIEHFVYTNIEDIDKHQFIEDMPTQDSFEETFSNNNTLNYITSDLDEDSNDMIHKKYVEGKTHKEIGVHYSMTSTTISNKISYIKTKMKKKMENE
jgi:RNA polymerase sigma-70 factor (ECF subfamily)